MPITPIDYVLLLERNYPTSSFGGSCGTYDKINWTDTSIPKPTKSQLDLEWSILEIRLEMEAKLLELSTLAGLDVVAGFKSSALGSVYFYDSDPDSQVNLIGLVTKLRGIKDLSYNPTSKLYTNPTDWFPVRVNATDLQKTYTSHTLSQLDTVIQDGANFKLQVLQTFNNLKDQVLACTSIAEIRNIKWVSLAQI